MPSLDTTPPADARPTPPVAKRDGAADQPRILVLGSGPTGLGAGYRLRELGHTNFTVVDRNPYAGGLAHSFVKDGFTWDVGGHVMFSHYDYYDRLFETLMAGNYTMNDRESWVRAAGRWVPYPFQNNIRYLPKDIAYECIAGLLRAQACLSKDQILERARAAPDFGAFIDVVFGEGIARHFMRPYNFKVWAHPPEMMNKSWIGERVAVLDAERALRNLVMERDDFGWGPNNRFKYPLRGGTGAFYDAIARELTGHLVLNKNVRTIDVDAKLVTFDDASTDTYDHLISAMPLDVLARDVLIGDVPEHIRTRAAQLKHSSGHMVGLGIRRPCPSTKSWMYFPDDNCPFYRVTYLSNYSPYMTPDQTGENATHYSLLCEVAESAHKPVDGERVVEDVITGLENAGLLEAGERADIVSTWHHRAEYSYPTPSVDRDAILADVLPWLESRDILSRGRFGLWKYEVSNTDHTLMQGVEAVNRLLLGEAETTVGIVYATTADGRKAAVHERSPKAGSGEKRAARTV